MSRVRELLFDADPYAGFEQTYPEDLQGWGSKGSIFERCIESTRPMLIVEVGTWKGASAIHMAKLCRALGLDTEIVCVDTWLGSWEHWSKKDGLGSRVDLRLRNGYPNLYFQFLSNVLAQGLTDTITPLPMTGIGGAKLFAHHRLQPDLIYIDGDHAYEAVVMDLRAWLRLLAPGGLLIGDDYLWPGPRRAVDEIAAEGKWIVELHEDQKNKYILRSAEQSGDGN